MSGQPIRCSRPELRLVGSRERVGQDALSVSDAELVVAACAGDRAAKQKLYERHVTYLAGICMRLLRNREDGLEVVQDAFVVAFTKLDTLADPGAFRAWVAQIAVRLVRKRLRRARIVRFFGFGDLRNARGGDRGGDGESRDELDAFPELAREDGAAEARSELAALERVLCTLPPEQRIAWTLRHVEEEPLEMVAAACECSLATVKRWIRAAEERIQGALEVPS